MNTFQRLLKISLPALVFIFVLGPVSLLAEPGDLKIAGLEGDVQVGGAPAVKDQLLMEGDILNTGPDGFAVLEMEDYGKFSISPQSELSIEVKQVRESLLNAELKLAIGSIKADLEKLPKGSSFKLSTPTSIAAVRGTVFLITVNASGAVSTYVYSGEIAVESVATGETATVGAGECVVTTSGGTVQPLDPNSAEYAAVVQLFNAVTAQEAEVAPSEPASAPAPTQPTPQAVEPEPDLIVSN